MFAILIGLFLVVMAAVTVGGWFWIARRGSASPADSTSPAPLPEPQQLAHNLLLRLGSALPAAHKMRNPYRSKLAAAGYVRESALQVFYGSKIGFSVVLAVACALASASRNGSALGMLAAALCGAGFGFLLPDRLLKARIAARMVRLRAGIPTALDLLTLSVEAGQGLDLALLETARGLSVTHPDLSREFWQAHLEMRASKARQEVLQRIAERNREPELRKLVGVLIDADRFGASLGPALRTHSKYLRTRLRQQAQASARKVGVKLIFPVFFLIFPSVLLVTLGPACIMVYQQIQTMLNGMPP
ncbi:MAG: type II secretion system F family protein [Bryobacteraceae bacterium]|jgi:tight adherence protein C